jgi:F-type H+-transporting ATPase subunit beta
MCLRSHGEGVEHTTNTSNFGVVVSVRGSVVDTRSMHIEVLAQLDAQHRVRGIALTPTQGLARGMRWKTRAGR